jgi:hypothetical protein
MDDVFDRFRAMDAQLSNMPVTIDFSEFTVDEVKTFMRLAAAVKGSVDRVLACGAAEIHQRSRREFGSSGLARAEGHVNPQTMIAELTGSSRSEAKKLDRLGRSVMEASPTPGQGAPGQGVSEQGDPSDPAFDVPVSPPWHAAICARMLAGELSPDRFEALRAGFGDSSEQVPAAALAEAAERLVSLLHPDDLPETAYRDARAARALLDRAGLAELEKEQYARRQAKVWRDREGMVHLNAIFAPEDGTFVKNTLDLLLGPRIGGPRLANSKAMTEAQLMKDDPRTVEQLAADMLVTLLKAGVEVKDSAVLAKKRPSVQIVVTASELTRPGDDGVAFIEGTGIPVTMNTVNRMICDTGYRPVILDAEGSPLDLGREHRLFQPAQRLALNTTQGGCVWPGCEKPPSFCEIHHIDEWSANGKTDVLDGVLLCKHHHVLLHSNGWKIHREGSPGSRYESSRYENRYWITPPSSADPERRPILLRFRGVARQNPTSIQNPTSLTATG